MQWFNGDEAKTQKLRDLLTQAGEPDLMADMERLENPTRPQVQALLERMRGLTEEQLRDLIGPRNPNEPLFGIDVLQTDHLRLIFNRWAPMKECGLHDHGGLQADLLLQSPMLQQKYVVDETVPFAQQQPERMVGAGSTARLTTDVIQTIDPQDIHSIRAMIKPDAPDATDVAIYYNEGRPLGEQSPWRVWDPATCAECRSACATLMKGGSGKDIAR
ncbi:MAG TPA: hypothetical protein VFT64_10325 [Rickettsiales bacterium]|nr:hypothetical protein [Rickettsiales bacterium]